MSPTSPSASIESAPAAPLAGMRVIDLTRALAGPFCTALLGDLGADVIKVEGLPHGDSTRAWPPRDGDRSLYFVSTNRNKRSIAVDLRSTDAKTILGDLLADADVLVENFRHGVLAKLGLDPVRLANERPDLVVSSVTGFGEVGPMRSDAGFDQIAQGMSGMMSVTGFADGAPTRMGIPVVDIAAGMFSAMGIIASLLGRERGIAAPRVSTSLLESATSMMVFQAQRYLSLGEVPGPQGNDHPVVTPYGMFEAQDCSINVAAAREPMWRKLCHILGRPDLLDRPEYATGVLRTANRAGLTEELNQLLRARPAAEWFALMRAEGIPCGPIYTMDQVFAEPQVQALGMVQDVPADGGSIPLLRGPLSLDGRPTVIRRPPPRLGEQSHEILAEIGYTDQVIEDLVQRGVVGDGLAEQAFAGRGGVA